MELMSIGGVFMTYLEGQAKSSCFTFRLYPSTWLCWGQNRSRFQKSRRSQQSWQSWHRQIFNQFWTIDNITLFKAPVTARMDKQHKFLLGFCWALRWWLHLCTCSAGAGANSEGLLNLSIEVRVTSEVSVQKLLCHIGYVNFSSNACTAVWSPTERKYWQITFKVIRAIHHSGGLLPDIELDQLLFLNRIHLLMSS